MSLDEEIPNVLWPNETGEYKIIQICNNINQPYLRFSEKLKDRATDEFHREILERFAKEINISCGKKKSCDGDWMVPILPESSNYRILGMGKCFFNAEKKEAEFYGKSRDYGVRVDEEHLKLIKSFFTDINIKK